MVCSEGEATKKFCPHIRQIARTYNEQAVSVNFANNIFATCIGAQCMMWRWYSTPDKEGFCGLAYGGRL